jgi:hypothetical protein
MTSFRKYTTDIANAATITCYGLVGFIVLFLLQANTIAQIGFSFSIMLFSVPSTVFWMAIETLCDRK